MKPTFEVSALVLTVLFSVTSCNDIILGYNQQHSTKIFSEIKEADPALWTRTDDVIVNAPPNEVISAIYVTDLRDYKDGLANIESGGIGDKRVTIGLKSPSILRGYKFEIEVFSNNPNAGYFSKGGLYPSYNDGQFARKY